METPNARLAMTIAKGILSSGFLMAAGFYGYSVYKDDSPAQTPEPPAAETPAVPTTPLAPTEPTAPIAPAVPPALTVTPTTAADQCALDAMNKNILPSIDDIATELSMALQHGLAIDTIQPIKRIEAAARYRMERCEETTGTPMSTHFFEAQMQTVQTLNQERIATLKPTPQP